MIERTASGLPLFSYRPERVNIAPGSSQQVEVFFRPDRGRFVPFREDLNVRVGDTDEVLTVGLCGRCWRRQMFVVPANPSDEPFSRQEDPSAAVEDLLATCAVPAVRQLALDARKLMFVKTPSQPCIILEYPDPYAAGVDPSSYVVSDGTTSAASNAKTAKAATTPTSSIVGRMQSRKLLVCNAKLVDGRPGSANGTFEVVLSAAAKECGMFALSVEKGAVNIGSEVVIDVSCTLPQPKGIGGLSVGSWKVFNADVVVKGGWISVADNDEERIPIVLKAFVSL
jgi:hypothetical protein